MPWTFAMIAKIDKSFFIKCCSFCNRRIRTISRDLVFKINFSSYSCFSRIHRTLHIPILELEPSLLRRFVIFPLVDFCLSDLQTVLWQEVLT